MPWDRRDALTAGALFVGALALRLAHLAAVAANDPFFSLPDLDPAVYHAWAQELARGNWVGDQVFFNGPLYPYLLGGVYSIFGPSFGAATVLHAVLGAGTAAGLYALGRTLFDRASGAIAALLWAVYEMSLFYEGSLLATNLVTPLTLAVVGATVWALDAASARRFALCGLLTGLAVLGRESALLFIPGVALWFLWHERARLPLPRRAAWIAAYAGAATLAITPAVVRNVAIGNGQFVLTNSSGGMNLYLGFNPEADGSFHVPSFIPENLGNHPEKQRTAYQTVAEQRLRRPRGSLSAADVSRYWQAEALAFAVQNPGTALRLIGTKLALYLNHHEIWNVRSITLARDFSWVLGLPLVTFAMLLPLAIAGIVLTAPKWQRLVPVYGMIGVQVVTALLVFVLSRYRMPVVPLLALFAGAGAVGLVHAVRHGTWLRAGVALGACALAIFVVTRPLWSEDLTMAHYNLGNRYKDLERWELAIEKYETALRLRPGQISFHNNLALVYERSGSYPDEAVARWQRVRALGRSQNRPKYVERANRHLEALGAAP